MAENASHWGQQEHVETANGYVLDWLCRQFPAIQSHQNFPANRELYRESNPNSGDLAFLAGSFQ